METGKFSGYLRVMENRHVSRVDRVLKSSNSTFKKVGGRLDRLGKGVDFDFLFLSPPSGILFT